jgi:hypothetical protein
MANTHLSVCTNLILLPGQTSAYSPILSLDVTDTANIAIIYNISLCNSSFSLRTDPNIGFSKVIFADIYLQNSSGGNNFYIAKNIKLQTHYDAASYQFSDPITLVKDVNSNLSDVANKLIVEIKSSDSTKFSACSVYAALMES